MTPTPHVRDFPLRDYPILHERAAAWREDRLEEPPAPRPAATVMLVRDGAAGIEVFMLRRVGTMVFAPNVLVFPGGGVDPRDSLEIGWGGPPAHFWTARLGTRDDDHARELVVAAVRELFEECGLLLASPPGDRALVDTQTQPWTTIRQDLAERRLSLGQVLREQRLELRADLLRAQAHWVTPVIETRQFDTRIFVARMPEGKVVDNHTTEAEHAEWLSPREVVRANAAKECMVLPPTLSALEDAARFDTAEAFWEHEPVIRRIRPYPVVVDDQVVLRAEW